MQVGFLFLLKAKNEIDQDQNMQNNMIEIGDQSFFAHREKPDRIPKTIVITLNFLPACAKDRIKPMTEKLHDEPKSQNREQNPFSERLQKIIAYKPDAVQAEHDEFCAFYAHAFDKDSLPDIIAADAAEKPQQKCGLT